MKNKVQIIVLSLIFWTSIHAQSNDFGMWMSFELQKKIDSHWSVGYEEELRIRENMSLFSKSIHDIGVAYKLTKKWKLGLNYQFATGRDRDNDFHTYNRIYSSINWKDRWGRISLESRTRIQNQYRDLMLSETGKLPEYYFRERVKTSYYLNSQFSPFFYIESFFNLNDYFIDKVRFEGGILFNYSNNNSISVSYLYQREFFVQNPNNDYVVKIGHNIDF